MLKVRYTKNANVDSFAFGAALSFFILASLGYSARTSAQEFDVNKVFWCDAGKKTGEQTEEECLATRTMILSSCTVCHAFTPIVKAQKTKQQWLTLLSTHRDRVKDLSDKDVAQIGRFLQAHYNPANPVPKLPPALDALGVPAS
jgi:hypothetical protein